MPVYSERPVRAEVDTLMIVEQPALELLASPLRLHIVYEWTYTQHTKYRRGVM